MDFNAVVLKCGVDGDHILADAVEAALNAVPQSADTGLEAALDADRMARDIVFSRFG